MGGKSDFAEKFFRMTLSFDNLWARMLSLYDLQVVVMNIEQRYGNFVSEGFLCFNVNKMALKRRTSVPLKLSQCR